jgi:hypothetical protein
MQELNEFVNKAIVEAIGISKKKSTKDHEIVGKEVFAPLSNVDQQILKMRIAQQTL